MKPLQIGDRVMLVATDCRVEHGSLGTITDTLADMLAQRPDLAVVRWDSGIELVYERRVLAKAGAA